MQDPLQRFAIDGRVAIVTGASSGLGDRFADVLAAAGARVVLAARRVERIEAHAERLRQEGRDALAVECDVSQEYDVERLIESTLDRYRRIDCLVNNAGIGGDVPGDEGLDSFRRVLEVNLVGLYACARAAGKIMVEQGSGTVVNIASVSGMAATDGGDSPSYVSSKAGVINLTRELAVRWAGSGVRVNAIAPGYFPSEMTVQDFGTKEGLEYIRANTPMGRGGRIDELDGALLFLVSDASSYVAGHTLVVDGGWTAR
jgi:NAD(P)-dependent dehydrogenase (short-subunit alcohol dehydrogenase family)